MSRSGAVRGSPPPVAHPHPHHTHTWCWPDRRRCARPWGSLVPNPTRMDRPRQTVDPHDLPSPQGDQTLTGFAPAVAKGVPRSPAEWRTSRRRCWRSLVFLGGLFARCFHRNVDGGYTRPRLSVHPRRVGSIARRVAAQLIALAVREPHVGGGHMTPQHTRPFDTVHRLRVSTASPHTLYTLSRK